MTGITLSEAQRTLCNQKAYELALDNRWRVRLQDYRELAGERFDRVVSVGMAEHVGRAFLPAYAAALARCLHPGGLGVVQTPVASAGGSAPSCGSHRGRVCWISAADGAHSRCARGPLL